MDVMADPVTPIPYYQASRSRGLSVARESPSGWGSPRTPREMAGGQDLAVLCPTVVLAVSRLSVARTHEGCDCEVHVVGLRSCARHRFERRSPRPLLLEIVSSHYTLGITLRLKTPVRSKRADRARLRASHCEKTRHTRLHPVSWRHAGPHSQYRVAKDMCWIAHDADLEQD